MAVSVAKVLTKIFGSRNERLLKRYHRIVDQVNALEPEVSKMSDEALRARTQEIRASIVAGKLTSAEIMPEAFAIIRESMDRHIGVRAIFNPDENFDPDLLDDDMLDAYDRVQREMIATGEPWWRISIPPKIYEAVRKIYPESRPPFRARCFDVQLIGGMVLYDGRIAEMATGEGKTFVAPLACFMRVLEGFHAHVVTVNDYLVRRDATWVKPAFENLGIKVGFIQSEMEPGGETRKKAYECDITYGTNAEFGFDFLRDNMKEKKEFQVQGPLDFAIVDEVDSILIDEARTPLIISGAANDDPAKYRAADAVARKVIELNKPWDAAEKACDIARRAIKAAEGDEDKAKGKDKNEVESARRRKADAERALSQAEKKKAGLTQFYEVELDRKSVHLTHEGIAAAQDAAGVGSFYVGDNMEWPHLMEQALRAHVVYERDRDYVVERGNNQPNQSEVCIVDEYTGRKMAGRQWSEGLHQAVEAKEKVTIKEETQTLATITLQNFFKMYKRLSGMTGTAQTEAEEFGKIYRLDVVTIPTNRTMVRADHEDRVYRTEREKWEAIIDEIKEFSDNGRPVLVGTTSVEKSEMLAAILNRKYGVEHEVLNAKQHEREAQIVLKAGQQHVNKHGQTVGNVTIATNMAGRGTDIKLAKAAFKAGGLHVIGTERHTARRIDNQLRGRAGRQGDPGSSRFYVSLQDDLMKMFAGDWTIKVLGWLGMEEGMAIEDKRISRGILRAQKKVEERNFMARKNLLEYDEVMDHQRVTFYGMRQQVLENRRIDQVIWNMIGDAIRDAVDKYLVKDYVASVVSEWARRNFEVNLDPYDLRGMRHINELEPYLKDQARAESETSITATLGEFMGEDPMNSASWDAKGLSSWAMSRFHVNLPTTQIRRMSAEQVEERLRSAAIDQVDKRDCSPLLKYLEPLYPENELAGWAREKFGIEIKPEELSKGGRAVAPEEIADMIETRGRAAYKRRDITYPIEHMLTGAFGEMENTDNVYVIDHVKEWAKKRFDIDIPADKIRGKGVRELFEQFVGYQKEFIEGNKVETTVDALMAENKDPKSLIRAFNERFETKLHVEDLEDHIDEDELPEEHQVLNSREILVNFARHAMRRELTDLEQYVLVTILDSSWKDHLYAMDMLKAGIGLHAFAERDPRVLYKKEGFRFFQEMMAGVRDKVTDLIFRARIMGQAQVKSAYKETAATHEDIGGYGVAENLAATANVAQGGEMQAAANRTQGEGAIKTKPITRDAPKVGRNDPCPCGSGKKYKKCHGASVA